MADEMQRKGRKDQGNGNSEEPEESKESPTQVEDNVFTPLQLPKKWRTYPFEEAFEKGLKPRQKTVSGKKYMVLARGRYTRGFGAFQPALWDYLIQRYEEWAARKKGVEIAEEVKEMQESEETMEKTNPDDLADIDQIPDSRANPPGPPRLSRTLTTHIRRPAIIPPSIQPDLNTLYLYMYVRQHGYDASFQEFINETIKAYFAGKGILPGIILQESMLEIEQIG